MKTGNRFSNEQNAIKIISGFIILLSVFLETALIAVAYLAGVGATSRDDFTDYTSWVVVVGTLALGFIFCLNVVLIFIRRARKMGHIVIALTSIIQCFLLVHITQKIANDRRCEFVQSGRLKYQGLVNAILKGDTNWMKSLPRLGQFTELEFEGSYAIDAETDFDGAVEIMFWGRDHDPYGGYLYYTGQKMTPEKPNSNFFRFTRDPNPEFYYLLLTNDWYTYNRPSGP
jgi:hypothetical protein